MIWGAFYGYAIDFWRCQYAMFAFRGKHTKLELTDTRDFWADTKVNMEAVVYPEDKQSFSEHINRETLLKAIQNDNVFDFKYRLLVEGEPVWFQMKAVLGHAAKLICETFEHSPVFRVGGDEFVVVYDYQNHWRENEYLAL